MVDSLRGFFFNIFLNLILSLLTFRICLGLCLRNITFKSKRVFGQKLHSQAFVKFAFWPFLGFLDI
jgi:hypothetical protein